MTRPEIAEFLLLRHGLREALVNIPPPPTPPFDDINTFEPIGAPWPAIRKWLPADGTDPRAVFPEGIVSTHRASKEMRLDDKRPLGLEPTCGSSFPAHRRKSRCKKKPWHRGSQSLISQ